VLLTGGVLAAQIALTPVFAHEATTGLRQAGAGVLKGEPGDLIKKFVNEAHEANKGKAPAELKGHQDEMKEYVGWALDAQQVREKKYAADVFANTLKLSLQTDVQHCKAACPTIDIQRK